MTALWITPPVKNVWRSGYDLGGWKTGYHGYWTQDFLDIDPHLTSAVSMKGEKYPDDAEGRLRQLPALQGVEEHLVDAKWAGYAFPVTDEHRL